MEIAVLVVAVTVERCKLEATRTLSRFIESVDGAIENLPDVPEKHPCTNSLICQREGVRHKVGCIGKKEPFDTYARDLAEAMKETDEDEEAYNDYINKLLNRSVK
jgi:hypothetical protein